MESFSIQKHYNLILRISAFCWIVSKFLSRNLWGINREFPLLPIFDIQLIDSVHTTLFYATFSGIILVFLFPTNRFVLFLAIGIETFSCVLDQMRWQPWQYQYMLTLFFGFLFKNDKKHFLLWFFWLLAFTYIYSGIHKFNGGFLYSIWENQILRKGFHLSEKIIAFKETHYAGLIMPLFEIVLGISLLFFKKFRKWIIILLIIMHLLIILFLSSLFLNQNSVVIPWNIAMILVLLTYIKCEDLNFVLTFKYKLNFILIILIGVMPITNLFGIWDDYTSFKLYSGNTKNLKICISEKYTPLNLKSFIIDKQNKFCNNSKYISVDNWSYNELNVPFYSEKRTFLQLKQILEHKFPNSFESFVIIDYPFKKENFDKIP